MKYPRVLLVACLLPLLAACEQLGIEDPVAEKAREEAEGRAIGSGCRQTGRPLEECYQINRRAPKAAIFAGWREMDAYMRENKIEEIRPETPEKAPAAEAPRPAEGASPKPATPEAATQPAAQPAAQQPAKPAAEPARRGRSVLAR